MTVEIRTFVRVLVTIVIMLFAINSVSFPLSYSYCWLLVEINML